MKRNLVLIGYRGTGKSTVAKLLAQRTGWPMISLDKEIVRQAGMAVPEIVEHFGWPRFRELEREQVSRAVSGRHQILDCGGGVVEDERNVSALRETGYCVLLTAEIPTITKRIGGDANRPSLTGKSIVDEIAEKLEQRGPLYRAAADLVVATDHAWPGQTVDQILSAAPDDLFNK